MSALPRRADRPGDHLIVCGDGPLAFRITEELSTRYGEQVTVLLPSRRRNYGPQIAALPDVRVLEHPELTSQAFTDADVESARALAVVWQDDVGNFHAGLRATELNPALRLVLAIYNRRLVTTSGCCSLTAQCCPAPRCRHRRSSSPRSASLPPATSGSSGAPSTSPGRAS